MRVLSLKGVALLGVVAAFAIAAGIMSQGTARAEDVPTKAQISTTGAGPVIECKWELPDMDSAVPGIQYTKVTPPATHGVHDDDSAIVPDADNDSTNGTQVPCAGPPTIKPTMPGGVQHMIQVAPNFENLPEQRRIENWIAVDNPGTVSDVFWQMYEPCAPTPTDPTCDATGWKFKVQVHGVKLTALECNALLSTSATDGSMTEAAIHNGEVTQASFDDANKGMLALCQQGVKGLYHQEWLLSKDQPCGVYEVRATAVSIGGATTTLTNYIDILCTFMLKVDFGGNPPTCPGGIDFGVIVPGSTSTVGGDLLFAPPCDTAPSVKNVGNAGMGLKLSYTDLVGATFGKHIWEFDACYGRTPDITLLKCFPSIVNNAPVPPNPATQVDFGTLPQQVLCANEVGKLDPSVHPQIGLPADSYSGMATLIGYLVPGECFGNKHKPA